MFKKCIISDDLRIGISLFLEFKCKLGNAIFRGVLAGTIWINGSLTDHDGGSNGGMKKNGHTENSERMVWQTSPKQSPVIGVFAQG